MYTFIGKYFLNKKKKKWYKFNIDILVLKRPLRVR